MKAIQKLFGIIDETTSEERPEPEKKWGINFFLDGKGDYVRMVYDSQEIANKAYEQYMECMKNINYIGYGIDARNGFRLMIMAKHVTYIRLTYEMSDYSDFVVKGEQ